MEWISTPLFRFRLACLKLKVLILLRFLCLPASFAQSPYSACSQTCIDSQDTAFNIPSIAVYGAVANNCARCNNEPFLKATAQCIYQTCGEQDLSVTVGLFISACTSTDTPTSYTSQQLIAFGSEGASSTSSSDTSSSVPIASGSRLSTAGFVPTLSTPAPPTATTGTFPNGGSSSTLSNTSSSSSSKHKLSGGAIAGIIIGVIIAPALLTLVIFLFSRNNQKHSLVPPVVVDDFGKTAGHDKAELDGRDKAVRAYLIFPCHRKKPPPWHLHRILLLLLLGTTPRVRRYPSHQHRHRHSMLHTL